MQVQLRIQSTQMRRRLPQPTCLRSGGETSTLENVGGVIEHGRLSRDLLKNHERHPGIKSAGILRGAERAQRRA